VDQYSTELPLRGPQQQQPEQTQQQYRVSLRQYSMAWPKSAMRAGVRFSTETRSVQSLNPRPGSCVGEASSAEQIITRPDRGK